MSSPIEISHAKVSQLDAIAAIADAVALRSSRGLQRGFLLGAADAVELSSLIESREIWVAELTETTVGFVVAHTDASPRFVIFRDRIPKIRWDTVPDFLDATAVYVDRIATRPGYHGVGRALYEALFHRYPTHGFLAGVAESPVRNSASIDFHARLGFHRVGTFGPALFGDFDDYVGGVFYRPPVQDDRHRSSTTLGKFCASAW
jgi:predicted GNAT superfamily acetyltransferase